MGMNPVPVLDKGYVRLIGALGGDISVVNAARCSFAKESTALPNGDISGRDKNLITYLAAHGHSSPFRHAFVTLEVKAPLFVARQWWKYVVGSDHTMDAWNEVSRRYVEEEPEFYIPTEWRGAPESKKQGSGDTLPFGAAGELGAVIGLGVHYYNWALSVGICAEQARLMLPAYAMYTTWRWSASLQSVCHFLKQRLADDAQHEIRDYAAAVRGLVEPLFPVSTKALLA